MEKINIQLATLIYVVRDGKVLLAKKNRKVFVGKYTGYGGKVEEGESEVDCAVRELESESGIVADKNNLKKVAVMDFYNENSSIWRVYAYIATNFTGQEKSTEEMSDPKWFDLNDLPYDQMPWSDTYWLPVLLIHGKKLKIEAHQEPFSVKIENLESF